MEIVNTGSLKRLEYLQSDSRIKALKEFMKIWGVGPSTANKLFNSGLRTVEEVKSHPVLLTEAQKANLVIVMLKQIGLKYIDELSEKMPRAEADKIIDVVKEVVYAIVPSNSIEITACGSYRRGKPLCGDVDIIMTTKEGPITGLVAKIVKRLEEKGFLTDSLSKTVKKSLHGSESYMGICQLASGARHRRIDVKVYPREQYGFALLYFTGSDTFNRSMRLFAKKKGFSLADFGLFPAIRIKNEKVWSGQSVPCYNEEEVFKYLHLNYKEPKDRDV